MPDGLAARGVGEVVAKRVGLEQFGDSLRRTQRLRSVDQLAGGAVLRSSVSYGLQQTLVGLALTKLVGIRDAHAGADRRPPGAGADHDHVAAGLLGVGLAHISSRSRLFDVQLDGLEIGPQNARS